MKVKGIKIHFRKQERIIKKDIRKGLERSRLRLEMIK